MRVLFGRVSALITVCACASLMYAVHEKTRSAVLRRLQLVENDKITVKATKPAASIPVRLIYFPAYPTSPMYNAYMGSAKPSTSQRLLLSNSL
jgi:hypothetical protein